VLDWLLEDDAPGVQLLARRHLLGESPRSRRMVALRAQCNRYPPVERMLAQVDRALAAGDYHKYHGATGR
jgi:ribosomal protein L21E